MTISEVRALRELVTATRVILDRPPPALGLADAIEIEEAEQERRAQQQRARERNGG